jgi:PDDEXK-like domain of unknown function (DUF3799)
MIVERKIGIFKDISFEEYIAIDAVNNSSLTDLERSAAHYYERHLKPDREIKPPTPAMELGTAIHTAILENEKFLETYREEPKARDYPDAIEDSLGAYKIKAGELELTKSGTKEELKRRILEAQPDAEFFDDISRDICMKFKILGTRQMRVVTAISDRIRLSDAAQTILSGGSSELTLLWVDPTTGLYCKARMDYLTTDGGITFAVDLKSTIDAREREFSRSIVNFSYHRQAAHYTNGLGVLGYKDTLFIFAAFETEAPYAAGFYYADQEMIEVGREELATLLKTLKDCREKNVWPAYDETLKPISLPKWKATGSQKELETF